MRDIQFQYKGQTVSGQIISSTQIEPHYYWFYFKDSNIQDLINDDCIGFKKKADGLHPTRIHTAHHDLVNTVRDIVLQHVNQS